MTRTAQRLQASSRAMLVATLILVASATTTAVARVATPHTAEGLLSLAAGN
jgi:hypothetical protein